MGPNLRGQSQESLQIVRTLIPISQIQFWTSKSPSIFLVSRDLNLSFSILLPFNKLRLNLDFICWFVSTSRIHFQSSIFSSFCGFEFRVSIFFRVFAYMLHFNNFFVLFLDSLQPPKFISNIPFSQVFYDFEFKVFFTLEYLQINYLSRFKLVLFLDFLQSPKLIYDIPLSPAFMVLNFWFLFSLSNLCKFVIFQDSWF